MKELLNYYRDKEHTVWQNKKRNEWKYQSFGASFLSNSNNASQKKILIKKDKNNIRNNKSISPDKKEKSISKSKNQLDDFNIDKLKDE